MNPMPLPQPFEPQRMRAAINQVSTQNDGWRETPAVRDIPIRPLMPAWRSFAAWVRDRIGPGAEEPAEAAPQPGWTALADLGDETAPEEAKPAWTPLALHVADLPVVEAPPVPWTPLAACGAVDTAVPTASWASLAAHCKAPAAADPAASPWTSLAALCGERLAVAWARTSSIWPRTSRKQRRLWFALP